MATLETEESGHCREVGGVERLKQETMYGLLAKKMAVVERWPSVEVRLCIHVCFAKSLILYFFNIAKIRLQTWYTR